MEILGGILAGLAAMAVLAGIGLAAIVALAVMGVLYFLTEMDFRKVFVVSAGVGLLAPFAMGLAIAGALEDGSLQRDLRDQVGPYVDLPIDQGAQWSDALSKLQELGEANERGELTDEEAQARAKEIFGDFEDLQISIDINGDGVVIGSDGETGDSGVPLELREGVEAGEQSRE